MKKIVICFISFLIVVSSIYTVQAANVYSDYPSLFSQLASDLRGSTYDSSVSTLNKYWNQNSSYKNEISADDLSTLCLDLCEAGFTCDIYYLSGVGYVIRGKGYITAGSYSTWTWLIDPVGYDDYQLQGMYLHTYDGYLLYSSTKPSPSLLYSINSTLNQYIDTIASRLYTLVYQTDQIEGYIDGLEGSLSTLIGHVDGVEGFIDQIEGRMVKTVSGNTYTLSDLAYNAWHRLDSIDGHVDQLEGYVDGVEGYIDGLEGLITTSNTRLSTIIGHVDGVEGYIDGVEGYVDGLEDLITTSNTRLSKIIGDVDGIEGYIDGIESSISTTNSRLSTANSYLAKLDSVVNLLTENNYMCSYLTDNNGDDYPTVSIPYQTATSLLARLNAVMPGRQVFLLKRDGTGISSTALYFRRASLNSSGYIRIVAATSSGTEYTYYLCDEGNNLYLSGQDYSASIYSRLSDVISAINNIDVDVDMTGVQLSLDGSNINLWNNNAYCCGYLVDGDGNPYSTITIPYDTAVNMIARFNTDYVGQDITVLRRNGSSPLVRQVKSSSLLSSGYIRLTLTSGQNYYLCDSVNAVYYVDPNSNYNSMISTTVSSINSQLSALDAGVSRLDSILSLLQERLQSGDGDHEHTYVRSVDQEPTCTVPGLAVYTCSVCGSGYTELIQALGHDWDYTEHVDAEYDEEDVEISEAYDLYTCTRCGKTERSYNENEPASGDTGTIGDLITSIFSKLGQFVGDLLTGLLNLLDKLLTGFDDLVSDFNDKAQLVVELGGDYPEWLSGVWEQVPSDLQLVLSFCLVVSLVGVIGKKLVFSS